MTSEKNTAERGDLSRRRFLELGAGAAAGLALSSLPAGDLFTGKRAGSRARSVIMVNNYGGPSHLDLFDMKPEAPLEIRGPFRPVRTRSAEFELSELLPLHGGIADRFSLVRTCNHALDALHETASCLIQTGRPPSAENPAPHPGVVTSVLRGKNDGKASNFLLGAAGNKPASTLAEHEPVVLSPHALRLSQAERERFGLSPVGDNLLAARKLVENGARFVTVNTSDRPRDPLGWDMHGRRGFSGFAELRESIAPRYDRAYYALITSLEERGMLDETLVCCLGEFGRSPRINPLGGRDHWTGCWTVYFAGGGVQGGRAIGRSDELGSHPLDRPTSPREIAATIYHCLGIPEKTTQRILGDDSFPMQESGGQAIMELF
ncbi:MAG: DUF1501 domain-containing protein [Planctomycetota bacterium]|nr:DUF1501 domain-containing protein [Planctomycetota bacterium]